MENFGTIQSSKSGLSRVVAKTIADSFVLSRGKRLFEENNRNFNLPLSKLGKLEAGMYIILSDYAAGRFPPTFEGQSEAYQAEIDYLQNLPGVAAEESSREEVRKPFWDHEAASYYLDHFCRLLRFLEDLKIPADGRLLELGCGAGWTAEFLALCGYSVTGTSISPAEIGLASQRAAAFEKRNLPNQLDFLVAPMEAVNETVARNSFDCVFVFEALHHAFRWQDAVRSAFDVLKPGGWLVLANEPNLLHTFISYRVARMANTHEIGMSRRAMLAEMKKSGYDRTKVRAPRLNNGVTPHWIAAQKAPLASPKPGVAP